MQPLWSKQDREAQHRPGGPKLPKHVRDRGAMCHYVQFPFQVSFLNNYSYYVGGQSLNTDKDLCSCSTVAGLVFNMRSVISRRGGGPGAWSPLFSPTIFNLRRARLGRADKRFCTCQTRAFISPFDFPVPSLHSFAPAGPQRITIIHPGCRRGAFTLPYDARLAVRGVSLAQVKILINIPLVKH